MSVLVFAENWDGRFKKLSFELVSYGARLAEMLQVKCKVLVLGPVENPELQKLGRYGADEILHIPDQVFQVLDNQLFTSAITAEAQKSGAAIILLSNNNSGKALAPRVSARMKAGIASGVSKLPLSTDPFVVTKKVYSGKAFARVAIKSPVKVLTLAQNSFELIENDKHAVVEKGSYNAGEGIVKTTVLDVQKQTGKILLTDAEIVVSGGRGMKSGDNWGPLLELAECLGAATACSRPVSDEGWRPHEEHTGQTGKIIAPNLYIAIGISGATQHLAGVSSSKFIVAINSDKDAPIFEAAQYGIIGDAQKILPKLVEAAKELKAK